MNEKYKDSKIATIIMYIMDQSFKNFWSKDFFNDQPIIIGYIPQISNDNCLIKQKQLISELSDLSDEQNAQKTSEIEFKNSQIEENLELIDVMETDSKKNQNQQLVNKKIKLEKYIQRLENQETHLKILNKMIKEIEYEKKETEEKIKKTIMQIKNIEANENQIDNKKNNNDSFIDGVNQIKDIEKIKEKKITTLEIKIIPLSINNENEKIKLLGKKRNNQKEKEQKTNSNTSS